MEGNRNRGVGRGVEREGRGGKGREGKRGREGVIGGRKRSGRRSVTTTTATKKNQAN